MVTYKGERFRVQTSGRYYQSGRKDVPERLLHRRVWHDANGPIPEGMVVHHKDGDWRNNALDNLELAERGPHQRRHMLEKNATVAGREATLAGLDAGRASAKAWHASEEGRAWHSEHAVRAWEGRERFQVRCQQCGEPFLSYFPARAKFCSRACEQYVAYRKHQTDERHCACCGSPFTANKYRATRFCSRACANRGR